MFEKICRKLEERSSMRIKKKFESKLWGKIKRKLPSRSNILMLQKLQESKSFHFHFNKRRDTFLCDSTKIPLMDLALLLVTNPLTLYGSNTPFYDVTISGGYFDHEHLQIFLNVLGRNILSLTLEFHEASTNGGPLVETAMNLPTLLLIQVPNIKQLRIKSQPSILKDASLPTRLFADIRKKPPILVPIPTFNNEISKNTTNGPVPAPVRAGPLSNLKYFCFYSHNTFIPSDILDFILKEAKLLRFFDWSQTTTLNEMYLPILQKSKKLHLLRWLRLSSFEKLSSIYIDMYKYGCGGQLNPDEVEEEKKYPALEELSLVDISKFVIDAESAENLTMLDDVSRIVTGILGKSANSLRYLSIPPLGNLSNLNWPVFPNLVELTLTGPADTGTGAGTFPENVPENETDKLNPNIYTPYFPRDYIFSKTFPSLKSIKDGRLVNPALSRYPWKVSIDTGKHAAHHLPNVESLDFTKGPILSALPSLVRTFQNLTCLKVGFVRNVRGAMRNFVEFKHLKTLVFGVLVNCKANQFPALDAALTGYSSQVCLRLFASSVNTEDSAPKPAAWMLRQKQKSILNLKDLRSLEICLVDMSEDWEEKYEGEPIITHLSGFLGFKKCQKLGTVKIWIHSWGERLRELKKQCVQVKPFVTSISAPHASLLGI